MLRLPFYDLFFLYLIKLTCSLFLNFTSSVWPQVLRWFFLWSPLSMLTLFLLAFTLLYTVPIGESSLHLNDWRKILEKILFGDHNLLGSAGAQKKQGTCLSSYCQGTHSVWDQDMEMCVPTMESQSRAWSTEGDAFREGPSLLVA